MRKKQPKWKQEYIPGTEPIVIPPEWICQHCNGDIRLRNPTGKCDHLYYPESCEICKDRLKPLPLTVAPAKTKTKNVVEPHLQRVEILASYAGKIATGRYDNENPMFSLKEVWNGPVDVVARQKLLSQICYDQFAECEQRSLVDRIMAERKDIRFYDAGNGKKYPSITSVLGWDRDFYMRPEELMQYAARGTIVHKQIEIYLTTGEWKHAKEIVELHRDYVVVSRGSLALSLDGYHIDDFCDKFKLETLETETVNFNHEHMYAGRKDWKGKIDGKITIIDFKTSEKLDKKYVLCQLAAHLNCIGNEDVEQVMAVPVNNTTKQGYSSPILMSREEVMPYFKLFLKAREDFKFRFGA